MPSPVHKSNRARTQLLGQLVLVSITGCILGLAAEPHAVEKNPTQRHVWTSVTYEERGLLDPNKLPTAAEKERAIAFFGPTTNHLESLILPEAEGLLSRVHQSSIYVSRTNTAINAYRLVFLPNQKAPTILYGLHDSRESTLRVYRWRREKAAFLSEAPLTTAIQLPHSAWQGVETKLASSRFWEKPSCAEWWSVKDGYLLILEVLDRGKYHLVCRAAGEDEVFEKLCWALLDSAPELSSQ